MHGILNGCCLKLIALDNILAKMIDNDGKMHLYSTCVIVVITVILLQYICSLLLKYPNYVPMVIILLHTFLQG